jgi:hypothetical protein
MDEPKLSGMHSMPSGAPEDRVRADALHRSAQQHHQSGRIMAAERDYRAAIAACPGHPAAEALAHLLFSQLRGKEATQVLLGHFRDAFGPVAEDEEAPRELAAAEASATRVAEGLRRHGTVLLRGCFPVPVLARLAPNFRLVPDQWGKPVFRLADMDKQEIEAALLSPLLRELVPALGLDLASWVMGSWVRAAIPKMAGTRVPFHQDMLVCARKCMNVWIALDPCGPGTKAPGLEVVARHLPALLPTMQGDANEYAIQHMEISEEAVAREIPSDALWRPRFAVGDALLFLGTTVHRTALEPGMDQVRTSIELRFFDAQ